MLKKALVSGVAIVAVWASAPASATPFPLAEIVNTTTTSTGSLVSDGLADAFDGSFSVSGLSGLVIGRRIDTLEGIRTYRVLDIFTNTTGSAITTTIDYFTNLGSDGGEFVVEEGTFRSISFQDFVAPVGSPVGEFDPVLAFTFGNNAFASANGTGDIKSNEFELLYDLTVDPGESIGLLQFATLIKDDTDRSGDVAAATAQSNALIASPDFSGLTTGQIASIRNFGPGDEQRVSEPAALALFGIGLVGLGVMRRRRTTS